MRRETVTPPTLCKQCGYCLNRAAGIEDDVAPVPGDLCTCINCGHTMVFTDGLRTRELTPKDLQEFTFDQIVTLMAVRANCMARRRLEGDLTDTDARA